MRALSKQFTSDDRYPRLSLPYWEHLFEANLNMGGNTLERP